MIEHSSQSMETTLYLVRHGETDPNRLGIVQGRGIDAALNETGRRQAESVAQRFEGTPIEAVYASTLRRAIETAEAVAARHALPVYSEPGLDEMGWGIFEGVPHTPTTARAFERMYERWGRGDFSFRIKGGESIVDVQERGKRAIEQIIARHPGDTVLIVTHGRLLRVVLASLVEGYGLERMQEIGHANTCVYRLTHRQGLFSMDLTNCTAHLESPVST